MNPDRIYEPIDATKIDAIIFHFRVISGIPCPHKRSACIMELAERFEWSGSMLFWLYNLSFNKRIGAEQAIAATRVCRSIGS